MAKSAVLAFVVDTSTPSAAIVRVSVDLGETLATSIELASALFEGKRGFGLLVVETSPVAFVSIDGEPRGPAPVGPLSLAVGRHTVVVDAPEYDSEERELEVRLGDTTRLEVSLSKPVGSLPFVLGGSGVAAVGGGAVAAIIASSIASDWKAACATGHCDPGYSREVYSSDEGRVLALNGVSVALIAVGAALVLAGGGAWLAR
ncbi:MAG: PEGA domain-containing protein [Deltaproteobacteria bacterium]|nr:PEGA domain-containing protein [Deltaproteobacteria bacterium]